MKEYYSNKKILEKNAEYNIILGERSNGKSYCIKMEQCLKKAIKQEKCTFVIIKRLSEDIKTGFIEEYFADMPISKLTKGKYNKIVGYRDGIYLAKEDEDEKLVKGLQIGKAMALSNDERYKSRAYPDITDIVFEEFVTNKLYLRDEVKRFMNLVSTILRRRKGRVWLIANTISRICPYFNEWGLRGIPTMKQGQIDLYTVNTENASVKIAVEYCGNAGEEKSGMFFGKFAKSIDGGAWECDDYPKLPEGDISYHYSIGFKYNDFGFIICLCSLDSDTFLYIKPARKVGDGEFVFPNRILTNEFSISRLISNALNLDVPVEELISKLYRQGKVCFSHNLCGADFTSCLLNSKIIL